MALVHAELTATCNSLGCAKDNKYAIDPQCSEAVRDLIKFLRRDGDDHEIRRFLGAANIVETDLLPIIVEYTNKSELFDLIIRLLVNLTTPALLIYNEQLPADKGPRQNYLQIELHLQKYKRAFTNIKVWRIIANKLAEVIQAEYHEKGEEKVLSTVRLLILVRNILHVPADNDAECRPDNDANLHDQVIWALHQSQLIDIIMYIACSENEQQYYLHAIEIISLMLRDQNATELATSSVNRSETDKQRDELELKIVLEKERQEKIEKFKRYNGSRHSKFGGRFVVSGMKSIGENDMVVSSMTSNVNKAFDRYKNRLKTHRNKMPLKESRTERKSAFSVRLFLKEFCIEFLHGAYNTLMKYIREILVRSKGQPNDESYYFWAMQFFMEFNRNYNFEIKLVSESMSLHIFHFVQERIEESREKLITDKKKIHVWSKRMHLGLKAYKELMQTLLMMYQSKDSTLKSSARTILTNLFYVVEYRDMLLSLLNLYDEIKFSRLYLKDLLETNHVFMKLLEDLGKRQRNLVVQKISKKRKNSKKTKTITKVTLEDDNIVWTNISPNLKETILLNELVNAIDARPYDPVSEVSMDDQKVEAMRRIRMHLKNKHLEEAVKLLRASREVWPEDNYFGKSQPSGDEELDILKEIFFADLGMPMTGDAETIAESNDQNDNEVNATDDEEDEEDHQIQIEESNFEFIDFVKKFAKPNILQGCCQLLKDFETNSTYTNHVVVKLLHRITFDCKYSALMFQASVFRIFQRIFTSKNPNHKELNQFAIFIMRKFTEVAKKNNKVFMELMFWKDLKTAYEIEEGYDADLNQKSTNWTEEQEDELHRLHEEYTRDMPEEDELTWICKNLIKQDRSRISVSKKLKSIGIICIKKKKILNREFSEAEIVQITQLVQEFRETSNPMSFIMEKLNVKRPKKHIIDKIVELGLVGDRKELRKKKTKNANKSDGCSSSDESDESDNGDDIVPTHHSLTSVYVLNAIKKVIDKDMKPALLWLIESLDEASEDLDVDESDIPLLPMTDECMTAVNDTDFQDAMIIIGLNKPSGIQETYWRIPGKWQANDIRQRSITIRNIIEGNFVTNVNSGQVNESSDEEVEATFDRIRKSLIQNNVNDNTGAANQALKSNTSEDSQEPYNKQKNKLPKKIGHNKRKFLLEDSDVEDEVTIKKKIPLDDSNMKTNFISSDEENVEYNNIRSQLNKKNVKNDELEGNMILKKKKKIFLEDSDEDDVTPIHKKILLDNSDEEDSHLENNVIPMKNKRSLEVSDEEMINSDNISTLLNQSSIEYDNLEGNMVSMPKKKLSLEDNNEDVSDKEIPLLENSDSDEEEIGLFVKKTKPIFNDDSD